MVTVVIPTRNAARTLPATLSALVPAVVDGVVREVIVVDGGSTDDTRAIADFSGAKVLDSTAGRGPQLQAGGQAGRHRWLLFLHSDTVLEPGWHEEAMRFMEAVDSGSRPAGAGVFRFTLDDNGLLPRLIERGVQIRCGLFAMPYGDQGLLIPRSLYDEIGGFMPMPLFEDVDIVRRLGRRRITMLRTKATTSAVRYKAGYASRVVRNWYCVMLYYLGVSPQRLEKFYNNG